MELFPASSLTPKQTVILGELLRDHPNGQVVNHNGRPVFVSSAHEDYQSVMIPLSVVDPRDRSSRQEPDDRSATHQILQHNELFQ